MTKKSQKYGRINVAPHVKRILVCREKHCDRYFHVPTNRALFNVCLKLVKDRHEDGFYYDFADIKEPEPIVAPIDMSNLPDYVAKAYNAVVEQYNDDLEEYESHKADLDWLNLSLEDGRHAYDFLQYRAHYEYEDVELLELE